VVNTAGSLVIGVVSGWIALTGAAEAWHLFLVVGFCGGFTTFSTFSYEAATMLERGEWSRLAVYAALSVILTVAGVLCEPQDPALWSPEARVPIFFRAKGVVETLLIQAGYVPIWERETEAPALHPGAAARISIGGVGGTVVGSVGELHPQVAGRFELDVPCAVFEIDLDALSSGAQDPPQFREVSRQPLARRDLAVLLDRDQPAAEVEAAIRATAGEDLIAVELFDRYEGRGVPAGRVSLAFRLAFQRADRALTEKEIGKAVDRIVRMLRHRFGGELR